TRYLLISKASTKIATLSLPDALPIFLEGLLDGLFHIARADGQVQETELAYLEKVAEYFGLSQADWERIRAANMGPAEDDPYVILDRKSTRLNSSHVKISYAVFCLKKK